MYSVRFYNFTSCFASILVQLEKFDVIEIAQVILVMYKLSIYLEYKLYLSKMFLKS